MPTLIFAPNFRMGMVTKSLKPLLVAVFSVFLLVFSNSVFAQDEHGAKEEKKFDAAEVIFGHVLDNHEYHFTAYEGEDGKEHAVAIPLPIILYSPQRGFTAFMSSKFEEGTVAYEGYKLGENGIEAVDANGQPEEGVKVYDLSITRNVIQMLIGLTILTWLMLSIAGAYKKGQGVKTSPKGKQNLIEPVIMFIRDEVAKPNLGHKYLKYLPYLLTVFFFILICNIFGLIPGTANVTGNIAFTATLGVISFIVIMFSTNKHFWGHIFNPPGVPGFVKIILVPVEILGIFIKPFALIIRLFANMVAGHIIIICLISLIFIFGGMSAAAGWGASPISIAFTIFIYFIEVLVAFLQAYIFTNLTAVFIGSAFEGGHDHHEETVHA